LKKATKRSSKAVQYDTTPIPGQPTAKWQNTIGVRDNYRGRSVNTKANNVLAFNTVRDDKEDLIKVEKDGNHML